MRGKSLAVNPRTDDSLRLQAQSASQSGLTANGSTGLKNRGFIHATLINAHSANRVKAKSVNGHRQNRQVGKPTTTHPSPFWTRLAKAWGRQGLPTSQNGVATKLGMSQGSTRRWFTGDGYPEIPQLVQVARLGKCSIHWLLTDEGPESLSFDQETTTLLRHWAGLPPEGRTALLRAAWMESHMRGGDDLTETTALMRRPDPKK